MQPLFARLALVGVAALVVGLAPLNVGAIEGAEREEVEEALEDRVAGPDDIRDRFETDKRTHDQQDGPLMPLRDAAREQRAVAADKIDEMDRALTEAESIDEIREAVVEADEATTRFGYYVSKSDHVRTIYEDIARLVAMAGGVLLAVALLIWQFVGWWRRREREGR